ncbi:Uncharacterised protein [Mycobacterium tuberculosis]|nr:Uncharacterised protein [Mycobacterium tuberculosis]
MPTAAKSRHSLSGAGSRRLSAITLATVSALASWFFRSRPNSTSDDATASWYCAILLRMRLRPGASNANEFANASKSDTFSG